MKITRAQLKQIIKEELQAMALQEADSGPDISRVTRGPLSPEAQPEYIGSISNGAMHVFKVSWLFGANKPAPQPTMYAVFMDSELSRDYANARDNMDIGTMHRLLKSEQPSPEAVTSYFEDKYSGKAAGPSRSFDMDRAARAHLAARGLVGKAADYASEEDI